MPRFCIDAEILGTPGHLVCDEGMFSWSPTMPDGAYHLTGKVKPLHDRCMDTLLMLNSIEIDLSPPPQFSIAMSSLMSGSKATPPWRKVMPKAVHSDFVKRLVSAATEAIAKADKGYYEGTWVPGNAVLRSLQAAKVDPERIQSLVEQKVHNAYVVETFKPNANGFAKAISYDRFGTLTGRCTVASGPSVLTLKKDYRDLIKSVHGDKGCIVSMDFSSLEPRVLLYEAGRRCEDPDLYTSIGSDLGYERKAIKGAVIIELYGGSKFTLGKTLGIEGKELNAFMDRVHSYFNTDELLSRVKKQFLETGNVVNRYGRRVHVDEPLDNVFINYYAQSSAADVALIGFSQVVTDLKDRAPRVRPLYLIYDALLMDVHEDDVETVMSMTSLKVPGYVQRFPVKVEMLSCTSPSSAV